MSRLIQLLVQNAAHPQTIRCEVSADGADVYLKGVISSDYGVSAASLREGFTAADGADIKLHINSPGGDVFEAREMQAVIAGYKGRVTAVIAGVAASAATIVSMAASQVHMVKGSRYMIHNGWSITMGDKIAHRATADLLDGFDIELANEYASKTGGDLAQMSQWMDAETWFTAEQALEAKFVDQVLANTKNSIDAAVWNLSAYRNAPAPDEVRAPAMDQAAIRAANARRLRLLQIA